MPADEPGYLIENMTLEDIQSVAAIEQASFADPWPAQYFRTELLSNKLALYLVVRHNARVIAYIGAWLIFEEAHITTLAVEEQYRSRGIASRLLNELISQIILKGVSSVTLEVRPSNTIARRFYEKQGFLACGYRRKYYRNEDAIIMSKHLSPESAQK